MLRLRQSFLTFVALSLAACGGGGGGGKSVVGTTAGYSTDGSIQTVTTTYSDGSISTSTFMGTVSTPIYSADGTQKTIVYSFPNGATKNGTTYTGTLQSTNYSADGSQKTLTYSFSDSTTYQKTLTGTIASTQWASDHITKLITYSFSDHTVNIIQQTVNPTLVTPSLTSSSYPSDWSSGLSSGTVTRPVTSPKQDVYGDETIKQIYEDGTLSKPFLQATLTPQGATGAGAINDPNAYVTAPTKGTYDLRWGTPDPAGPGFVTKWFGASGTSASYTYTSAVTIAGRTVSGQSSLTSGMTLGTPAPEVKAAWANGWTGQGQYVLMMDGYPNPDGSTKPSTWSQTDFVDWYEHGITTYLLANRYAQGAQFYLLDGNGLYDGKAHIPTSNAIANFQPNTHGNLANSVRPNSGFYFDVVNISLGYNYWAKNITNPTQTQVNDAFTSQSSWTTATANVLNGTTTTNYGSAGSADVYFTDAVITKAAGNDTITAEKDPLSYKLAYDLQISPRLLIVGALSAVSNDANSLKVIASYSNLAGNDQKIQSRFLTAIGGTPYTSSGIAISGSNVSSGVGTSYAAPRVAGYVAIVRQKFPNVSAANTADILLATARYDTLTCNPNCEKTIYGQGEASLSRALAPVGYLK